MPTADATKREYTTAETQAYERYISAVANHNIVCAREGATTKEKIDAAFAADAAYREFCRIAGLVIGHAARPSSDDDRVREVEAGLKQITEGLRSASSMLHGIFAIDVFCLRPSDAHEADHNAACTLLDDTHTLVRALLDKADNL